MQIVFVFVGSQTDFGIAHHKGGAFNAVGITAHHGTQEAAVAGAVTIGIIKTQHHVGKIAVFIGHGDALNGAAVI